MFMSLASLACLYSHLIFMPFGYYKRFIDLLFVKVFVLTPVFYVIINCKPTKNIFSKLIFYFFMSSTRFERQGSSSGTQRYIQLRYGTFYMHQHKQSYR
jgi:hypothetical protein